MLREEEGGSGAKERGFERSARRVGHRRAEVPAAERELLRGAVPQWKLRPGETPDDETRRGGAEEQAGVREQGD